MTALGGTYQMPVRPELRNYFKKANLPGQSVLILKTVCAQNYSVPIGMEVRNHWGSKTDV